MTLADCADLHVLMEAAPAIRDRGHGAGVSYSRKVFIPLTKLCRDSCHYCTFAHPPRRNETAYLSADEVLTIARDGAKAGCKEALFTLGDKPELRYRAARTELERLGHASTISYLAAMARLVFDQTGLLPHLNPGVMTAEEIALLRDVSVSQGLMLETTAERLSRRGGPHFGSPDKLPSVRLDTIRAAGEAAVPFTSGILIGIGETRRERIEALLALRDLHERHGHVQEIIIQNFRAKPGTRMAQSAEPSLDEHLWTIAMARILFGTAMNIQAPPNLAAGALPRLIAAGINDWGGVSPVTPDHVNPERPWPALDRLADATAKAGKVLVERLAVYPDFVQRKDRWIAPTLRTQVLRMADAEGFARAESWTPGADVAPPKMPAVGPRAGLLTPILDRAVAGLELREDDLTTLFAARGKSFQEVCAAADALRTGNVRRPRQLRGHPQHQLHQCVRLSLHVLRLLQRQDARDPARAALRPVIGRDRAPLPRGLAARRARKSACRAASIRAIPARPIWRSAAPSRRRSRVCTSTPSRRSKCRRAPRRWV